MQNIGLTPKFVHTDGSQIRPPKSGSLHVVLRREPFLQFLTITTPSDGYSEELDGDDARAWFKARGANMASVEKVLDHIWNFNNATFFIENPVSPALANPSVDPQL